MHKHIKTLLVSFFLAISLVKVSSLAIAQPKGEQWLELKNLDIQPHLPKYLLSRKTAVLVSVPWSKKDPNVRADWKTLAEKAHSAFKRMKIDAVAYYYLDDVFASPDANASIAKEMERREIKYILVLEQLPTNSAGVTSYRITISGFNDGPGFISERQKAWQTENPDLNVLLGDMRKDVIRAEMERENYLVPDIPEFFMDAKILQGKRIPTYAMDLKVDKLVIPKFKKYEMEDSTALDASTLQKIAAYNAEVDRRNKRLQEIMLDYPLEYVLSESSDDRDIYNQGHQFVLLSIHGTGKTIREMLNYEIDPYETDYVSIRAGSTLNTLSVDAVVYKYYVKHVYTQDAYLGSRWDADLTWEQALQNFIFHMKDILKVQ
ncbi:hypothetical protein SAMN04488029_2039 [Reichenbachiella faecimaris]|uniref:Uncharacterized protein n=1 Tax=Reichenbachiella faecimaris TaxID=692418 RepID=A0A1W2GDE3_REIFA|nr:hypothetical protein [Reichenbachiella faecimaris]SMD34492.1 hypothetical protein SAMN04488029_2039 [Reichenbachiella faecimaris]